MSAARKKPGPKSMFAHRFEKRWVQGMEHALCVHGCPVDAYVDRGQMKVMVRATQIRRAPKKLPPTAEFLGRYAQPFNAREFLDDVAAHLATVPPQVSA